MILKIRNCHIISILLLSIIRKKLKYLSNIYSLLMNLLNLINYWKIDKLYKRRKVCSHQNNCIYIDIILLSINEINEINEIKQIIYFLYFIDRFFLEIFC